MHAFARMCPTELTCISCSDYLDYMALLCTVSTSLGNSIFVLENIVFHPAT
jgi:hypothetical protein